MLGHFGAFGGFLKIGQKEYAVRGRTYRKIAELAAWYVRSCFCPITELRTFINSYPDFATLDFCVAWLMKARRTLFCDPGTKRRLESTLTARRFEIWQACEKDGLTFEVLDEHLDGLEHQELGQFLLEADRALAIANGVDELSYLATCMRMLVLSESDDTSTIEGMLARLCVKAEKRWPLQDILDCTPAMLGTLFNDPERLTNDAAQEYAAAEKMDIIVMKMTERTYQKMAANILEKQRVDAERPQDRENAKKNRQKTEAVPIPAIAANMV